MVPIVLTLVLLGYLLFKKKKDEKQEEIISEEPEIEEEQVKVEKEEDKEETKEEESTDEKFIEIENSVLTIVKETEGEDGASWDEITKKCEKAGIEKDSIEEALTSLMDKGLIYEPVLGTIKTT